MCGVEVTLGFQSVNQILILRVFSTSYHIDGFNKNQETPQPLCLSRRRGPHMSQSNYMTPSSPLPAPFPVTSFPYAMLGQMDLWALVHTRVQSCPYVECITYRQSQNLFPSLESPSLAPAALFLLCLLYMVPRAHLAGGTACMTLGYLMLLFYTRTKVHEGKTLAPCSNPSTYGRPGTEKALGKYLFND